MTANIAEKPYGKREFNDYQLFSRIQQYSKPNRSDFRNNASRKNSFSLWSTALVMLTTITLSSNCVLTVSAAGPHRSAAGTLYRDAQIYSPRFPPATWYPADESESEDDIEGSPDVMERSGGNVLRKRQFASLFFSPNELKKLPATRSSDLENTEPGKRSWRTVMDDRYYAKRRF